MYTTYWGLRERPFVNTANPDFLYFSKKHEEGLVRLLYAVDQSKGLSLLVGEPGTGKSFLGRILRKELIDRGCRVALLLQPDLDPHDFLGLVALDFGLEVNGASKGRVMRMLRDHAASGVAGGQENVLLVDNAETIADPATLREIGLLPGHEDEGRMLFHTILLARPEFADRLRTERSIDQQIGIRYHLPALDRDETRRYVEHRLARAGADRPLLDDAAFDAVHRYSGGVPREINSICDLALLAACGEGLEIVGEASILAGVEDYRGPGFLAHRAIEGADR